MAFLKFLFIFIVCLYAFRLLFRLFFPLIMRKMAEKMMRKGGGDDQQFQREFHFTNQKKPDSKASKKGEIRVDYIPPKEDDTSKRNPNAGEYVEFEEIK